MAKQSEEPKIRAGGCVFRVFTNLVIRASGQFIPGSLDEPTIADLSDVEDAMIQWLLKNKSIETAEGEPFNKATGKRSTDRPCPCKK